MAQIKRMSGALVTACAGLACTSALAAGPDVIVGDLPNISNYGVSGSVAVYAVGTTSCNVGDTELNWISSTTEHPVISQNMYRVSGGRFEQIGQSWLKHGFTALQGTVCSSCTAWPNGSHLGVGCSDPYSSGLNGTQSGLGPKSEVNAATGAFLYPWVNNGTGSGTAFKRLQVPTAKFADTSAIYFVASKYVASDDAGSNNNENNQSYRQVNIAPGTFVASLTGTTQRTKAAVYAWKENGLGAGVPDPNVFVNFADVAGDGRFLVASKAEDLGGGTWRYTYAVQNLTSDRSGQGFSVAIPGGTSVSNLYFNDVDYHSGEPYAGTNWTSSVGATSVSWSTQTFAANANANALRWDTVYSFGFDANVPPAGGTTTITLFKPGSPSSVTIAGVVPSPDGMAHPLNDNCGNAIAVGAGSIAFSTVGATTDGPNECTNASYSQVGKDIWFSYTAACDGLHTVNTCGSSYDTKVAVYDGSTCPTFDGTAIACNDDSTACTTGTLQSSLTFTAVQGNSYLIRVGGYQGTSAPEPTSGSGTLSIAGPTCGPQPPSNDACANAIAIADNVPFNGTTTLATNDGTATCGSSASSPDVWFTYTPTSSASVNVNTCGSGFDTVVSVYTGSCGGLTQVACNDDNNNGGNGACGGGLSSGINVAMTAGVTYHIRVAGFNSASGNFTLRAIGGGGGVPPANDDCANRPGVGPGVYAFDTTFATTDGPTHTACNNAGSNNLHNDLWYNYPATADGTLIIDTCDSTAFNSRVAVYQGYGCLDFATRLSDCVDGGCTSGDDASVSIPVVDGAFYTIRVGGTTASDRGAGNLTLTFVPAPSCVADVDDGSGTGTPDGGVTIDDLLYYLALFDAGNVDADVDDGSATGTPDGGVTIDDLIYFLFRFDQGC